MVITRWTCYCDTSSKKKVPKKKLLWHIFVLRIDGFFFFCRGWYKTHHSGRLRDFVYESPSKKKKATTYHQTLGPYISLSQVKETCPCIKGTERLFQTSGLFCSAGLLGSSSSPYNVTTPAAVLGSGDEDSFTGCCGPDLVYLENYDFFHIKLGCG